MAVVEKPNGKLRICIDPQPLNVALKREHYRLTVLDDILPELRKAQVFSKVDVKHAFWHVKLDDKSSKLTTMITPYGRYRWNRLPFGLKVSSEIFQKRLHAALSNLNGVFAIADDIIVLGCGNTYQEAVLNHDENLKNLRERCQLKNIILNDDKAILKQTELVFMGHVISDQGVRPDPAKVETIAKMPSPTDVSGVKRFCGMVQYLARFLPNLAADLEPLRHLTRKNAAWNWTPTCEKAAQTVKDKISHPPVLTYLDGLGAVLLQNDNPIEFASRALTKPEQNWAQIERDFSCSVRLRKIQPIHLRPQRGGVQRPQPLRVHSQKNFESSSKTFTSIDHAVTQI